MRPTLAWNHAVRFPTQWLGLTALVLASLGFAAPCILHADTVVHRVNCGGPAVASLDAGPGWSRDLTGGNASPYVNAAATSDQIFGSSAAPGAPHTSVPAYVPNAIFADERWDPGTAPEMQWEFPVANGTYRVNLMVMEGYSGTQFAGARRIHVVCEGVTRLSDYDIFARYGGYRPAMETFLTVVNDGSLSLLFQHIVDDPAIRGIEIVLLSSSGALGASPSSVSFGPRLVNTISPPQTVTLTNLGGPGDSSLAINSITVPNGFLANLSPQTLAPGESRAFQVRFAPTALGSSSANMVIAYNGGAGTLAVPLSGEAVGSFPVGFGKSALQLGRRVNPTSLQFGPDGRLYVAQKDGTLFALTVQRNATNNYSVTQTEVISAIRSLPNRNDDGSLNPSITERLVTGLLVTGSPSAPVVYVTSSDPRMNVAGDINLDTNSGILSRLDRVGGVWTRTDLVRGLPRSENDHCTNGMALDTLTNTLYVGQAGNANMGAPSLNFSFLPEYALAAAILSVDLDAIGNTTYDLPTLDDEDRAGVIDANDPFGGNDGKNQAIVVPGGPVQVHSPGYRNPYDVLIHSNGHLYTIDNGPNAGWGGPPVGAGPGGNCTNADNDNGSQSLADHLHMIPAAGFYAGHPNPTRASVANTFNASNPQSPVPFGNPVECEYRVPGTDGSLAQWNASTNGLVEYRASNFGGALQGALLATSFNNTLERIQLNAAGDSATLVQTLINNVGTIPLDVTAQGDGRIFHGTIWVADYISGDIIVFEPSDFEGGGIVCTGEDSPSLDEDGDGFSNADEIDNGTNACSAADRPGDFDGDLLSDLNDPDDDNDGLLDPADAFARDAANGATTTVPILYSWDGGDPGTGFFGLGFTGLMANGSADYLTQFSAANLTAGGAAGKLTVDAVSAGDALGTRNTQRNAFQFGLASDSTSAPFSAQTRLSLPFFGGSPADSMSQGLFVGTGTQRDFISIAIATRGGVAGIAVTSEVNDNPTQSFTPVPGILSASGIDLYLEVAPAAGTVRPRYQVDAGAIVDAGPALTPPTSSAVRSAIRTSQSLAVGILATSRGAAPFSATWDFLHVTSAASVGVPAPVRGPLTRLLPSVPHPMRERSSVRFELAAAQRIQLDILAVDGRAVRTLASGWRAAGSYALPWDGRDDRGQRVSPGVYFVRLRVADRSETGRLIVLD